MKLSEATKTAAGIVVRDGRTVTQPGPDGARVATDYPSTALAVQAADTGRAAVACGYLGADCAATAAAVAAVAGGQPWRQAVADFDRLGSPLLEAYLKHGTAGGPYQTEAVPAKNAPLWWHDKGLQQTASGYGARLTMPYMLQWRGKWRRVYCVCFSNSGSLYILQDGARIFCSVDHVHPDYVSRRRTIRATFANGDTVTTAITGTVRDIRRHYMAQPVNLGTGGADNLQACTAVEFLTDTGGDV